MVDIVTNNIDMFLTPIRLYYSSSYFLSIRHNIFCKVKNVVYVFFPKKYKMF